MSLKIIGGTFKGRVLKTPKQQTTRPTQSIVREALFNICQGRIEGASFLDLFAGSGAIGIEAMSRGAKRCTFIESDPNALRAIRENLSLLTLTSSTEVLPFPALRSLSLLQKRGERFDLIYADPPYDTWTTELFTALVPLLSPHSLLFLEERFHPKSARKFTLPPSFELKSERRFGETLLIQLALLP